MDHKRLAELEGEFETGVVIGKALTALSQGVDHWECRDCFGQLEEYLYNGKRDRVCLLLMPRKRTACFIGMSSLT